MERRTEEVLEHFQKPVPSHTLEQGLEQIKQEKDRTLAVAERQTAALTDRRYTMILVTYGKCVYWADGQKLLMEKGDLLLIPPGTAFYGKSIPTVFHDKFVVTFGVPETFVELPALGADSFIRWKPGSYELILERVKMLHTEWTERMPYYEVMGAAYLTELLTRVCRERERGAVMPGKQRYAQLMRAYIQKNHRGKVTKEELGQAIQKSPNHAAAIFREVTGQTISDYVHAQRMRTAKYLLADSLLTIAEISDYLGYSDVSYFYRIFKRTTGRKPSDYADAEG